jgi:hypothetical protein
MSAPTPEPAVMKVPTWALIGAGGQFADVMAQYLESPSPFFYFAFLTCLGTLLADKVTVASALQVEPRLYTVLVAESANDRKSTAISKTIAFFEEVRQSTDRDRLGRDVLPVLNGVGSAEGLARALEERGGTLLLALDELQSFAAKASIQGSSLLSLTATLFDRGVWDNQTKRGNISIRGAKLSMLAACTRETYATTFDETFLSLGFPNRLWLVNDRPDKSFAFPEPIPAALKIKAHLALRDCLAPVLANWDCQQPIPYALTPEARAIFGDWYAQRGRSVHERRLDTYGHRLALLLAVSCQKPEIDAEVMTAVVALLGWQLDVRRECDPIDADNDIARMEERIRRVLAKGPVAERDLKNRTHASRVGLWAWNVAVRNLESAGELQIAPQTKVYRLRPEEGS